MFTLNLHLTEMQYTIPGNVEGEQQLSSRAQWWVSVASINNRSSSMSPPQTTSSSRNRRNWSGR